MRVIVYSRVSTDAQERDGTSLDTQERAGIEFVGQHPGWSLAECIRDAASGFTLDRPGLARVRQLLRSGAADVVVSYAVDRLSRNQIKLAVLLDEAEQAGARLAFVTETLEDSAIGQLMLSVRAFAAELEREKIVERTTRGKLERARSGRIPGGMGRGTYGYVYNPQTGKREIEPFQAEVVRRIFQRYAEIRSVSGVARELDDAGIRPLRGSRWFPATVGGMLADEAYAGRLLYNRTRAVRVRADGSRRRRHVIRPAEEWIEIAGASPPIVDRALWQRVQLILTDPGRRSRRPAARPFPLRGRVTCTCGASLVGQSGLSKGRLYRYYRCGNAQGKHARRTCSARLVPAPRLEEAVWREVRRVLTEPAIVLRELRRQEAPTADADEIVQLERALAACREREKRLVRLYTFGEIDEAFVREEGADLRRRRTLLEERLRALQPAQVPASGAIDPEQLEQVCRAIAGWLARAGERERELVLEALQVAVMATNTSATVAGVLPLEEPSFSTAESTSWCCAGRIEMHAEHRGFVQFAGG